MGINDRFPLGFSAESSTRAMARTTFVRTGFRSADRTVKAISLAKFKLRPLEQLGFGTCWEHSGIALTEILMGVNKYDQFPICRNLVGYAGKKLDNDGRNPDDGGSALNALLAMSDKADVGIAHETIWPYPDDLGKRAMQGDASALAAGRRLLAAPPSQDVLIDAKPYRLTEIAKVAIDSDEEAKSNLANGHPNTVGMWWAYTLDRPEDATGGCLFSTYRRSDGSYGHALTEIGFVDRGVWPDDLGKYAWFQISNWHGQIYKPLPKKLADLVPGYKSDTSTTTSDFWIREDFYRDLRTREYCERQTAADATGFRRRPQLINGSDFI
jgi:hypothetical protein